MVYSADRAADGGEPEEPADRLALGRREHQLARRSQQVALGGRGGRRRRRRPRGRRRRRGRRRPRRRGRPRRARARGEGEGDEVCDGEAGGFSLGVTDGGAGLGAPAGIVTGAMAGWPRAWPYAPGTMPRSPGAEWPGPVWRCPESRWTPRRPRLRRARGRMPGERCDPRAVMIMVIPAAAANAASTATTATGRGCRLTRRHHRGPAGPMALGNPDGPNAPARCVTLTRCARPVGELSAQAVSTCPRSSAGRVTAGRFIRIR